MDKISLLLSSAVVVWVNYLSTLSSPCGILHVPLYILLTAQFPEEKGDNHSLMWKQW